MLDAAAEAMALVEGRTRQDLDTNRMLALSLVKLIEIVGEAANGVSPQFRVLHPQLPWRQIIAMRNRLIYAYFDVDLDRVWDTVTDDLPPLVAALRQIITPEGRS